MLSSSDPALVEWQLPLGQAESGAQTLLLEAVKYPGGCASTFQRKGYHFEAGATLFSGFAEGQAVQFVDTQAQSFPVEFELSIRSFILRVDPQGPNTIAGCSLISSSHSPTLPFKS